jgi:hypothetical protein
VSTELPIPASALSDKNARELIRAWAAHNGLHCSLNIGTWGENERVAWGILLSDVAHHVANAMHEEKGWDKADSIREIKRVFNEELESATAKVSGKFLKQ